MGREPLPPPRAPLSLFEKGARWCRAYLFVLERKALAYLFVVGLFWAWNTLCTDIFVCLFVCIGFVCLLIVLFFFILGKWTFMSSFWVDRLWFGLDSRKRLSDFPGKKFRFVNERFAWVKTKCSEIWREFRRGGGRGCVIIRNFTKFQRGVIFKHG